MPATDIGIDMGTANISVYRKGRGIYIHEPAVVAFDRDTNRICAYGEEAARMIGRTPGNVIAIHPMHRGRISDYVITERVLYYFIQKALGYRAIFKPRIVICVPVSMTDVERHAIEGAAYQAGARDVYLVKTPVAAALGAGVDITRPEGSMLVDIGAGITEIAVLSLAGIAVSQTLEVAGNDFNDAIIQYVRKKHGLFIDEERAEEIKLKIGTVERLPESMGMDIKGRTVESGLKRSIYLTSNEIVEATAGPAGQIVNSIRQVIERTPPDLAADLARRGIVLTGGGSLLAGLEERIAAETGIRAVRAAEPMSAVALGTGEYIEFITEFEKRE